MIFFERHLWNINSLVLSKKNFSSVDHFTGVHFFVGDSNFVSTTVSINVFEISEDCAS